MSSHEKVLGIFWATLQVMQDGEIVQVGRNEDISDGADFKSSWCTPTDFECN